MDLHRALRQRRTVQRFTDDPVPEDVVLRALDAANHAPCHKLTWPWRFTLPGPIARERLFQVALRLKSMRLGASPELEAAVRGKTLDPWALVVVSQVLDEDAHRRGEDYGAAACAVQNLMLSVHADGYGTKWSTGKPTRDAESYAILGIDPVVQSIIGFIWVGVPKLVPRMCPRPAMDELLRRVP